VTIIEQLKVDKCIFEEVHFCIGHSYVHLLSSLEIFTVHGRLIQKPGLCAGEESTSRNAFSKQLPLIYACIASGKSIWQ
jgi:hypothetical protein